MSDNEFKWKFYLIYGAIVVFVSLMRLLSINLTYGRYTTSYLSLLLSVGILFGSLHFAIPSFIAINTFVNNFQRFDYAFVYIYLTIFRTVFALDWPVFKKNILQILLLGIVAKLLVWIVIGFFVAYFLDIKHYTTDVILSIGMIFTATYAADHFEKLRTLRQIGVVLQGESFFSTCLASSVFVVYYYGHSSSQWAPLFWIFPTLGCLMGIIFVKLQHIFKCDNISYLLILVTTAYLILSLSFYTPVLIYGGVSCFALFVLVVGLSKDTLDENVVESVVIIINLVHILIECLMCFYFGILAVNSVMKVFSAKIIANLLVIIIMVFTLRALTIFIFYPLFIRTGYGLDWKRALILYFGSTLSTSNIVFACDLSHLAAYNDMMIFYIVSVVLFNLCLRAILLPWLLAKLQLVQASFEIKYTQIQKYLAQDVAIKLKILESSPFYNAADWTLLRDIYSFYLSSPQVQESGTEYKLILERRRQSSIVFNPSETSFTSKLNFRLKILKALKISVAFQQEVGLLSIEARRILYDEIELAFNRSSLMIQSEDLKHYWSFDGNYVQLKLKILSILPKMIDHHRYSRNEEIISKYKWCDNMFGDFVKSLWWSWLVLLLSTVNVGTVIYDFVHDAESVGLTFSLAIFFGIQVIAELMVWGFRKDRLALTIIDWVGVLTMWILVFLQTNDNTKIVFYILRCVAILRFYRIIYIAKRTYPIFINDLYHSAHKNIRIGFDIAKGLLVAYNDVLKMLPQLVGNDYLRDTIKRDIMTEHQFLVNEIEILEGAWPAITLGLETTQCSKYNHNELWKMATNYAALGVFNEYCLEMLLHRLHWDKFRIFRRLRMTNPNDEFAQLMRLPWIQQDEAVVKNILVKCYLRREVFAKKLLAKKMSKFQYYCDDVLVKPNEPITVLYILIHGIVNVSFTPNQKILKRLFEEGIIPVLDYPKNLNFSEPQTYTMCSSEVFGQRALLTGFNSDVTISCERDVKLVEVPFEVLNSEVSSLREKLGKMLALQIAELFILITPGYQDLFKFFIQSMLENSLTVSGKDLTKIKIVQNDNIELIILTDGVVDVESKSFIAPCLLPKQNSEIFIKSSLTWLVIVPSRRVETFLTELEDDCLVVKLIENKCGTHMQKYSTEQLSHIE